MNFLAEKIAKEKSEVADPCFDHTGVEGYGQGGFTWMKSSVPSATRKGNTTQRVVFPLVIG